MIVGPTWQPPNTTFPIQIPNECYIPSFDYSIPIPIFSCLNSHEFPYLTVNPSDVAKTIINHPPVITIFIGGINHSQMTKQSFLQVNITIVESYIITFLWLNHYFWRLTSPFLKVNITIVDAEQTPYIKSTINSKASAARNASWSVQQNPNSSSVAYRATCCAPRSMPATSSLRRKVTWRSHRGWEKMASFTWKMG